MLFIVALPHALLMQDQSGAAQYYNPQDAVTNSNSYNNPVNNDLTQNKASSENFDHIIKYKELLDAGVITQEEFDEKKKELLGI